MNDFDIIVNNKNGEIALWLYGCDCATYNEEKIFVTFVEEIEPGFKLTTVYEFETDKFKLL